MVDLSSELMQRLLAHRIPGLDLGDGFVYPDYAGQSILNLPASVCGWLGVPSFGAPALHQDILTQLGGPFQRVIFLLVDALAFHRLQAWLQAPEFSVWRQLAEAGLLVPLTPCSPTPCNITASLAPAFPPCSSRGLTALAIFPPMIYGSVCAKCCKLSLMKKIFIGLILQTWTLNRINLARMTNVCAPISPPSP